MGKDKPKWKVGDDVFIHAEVVRFNVLNGTYTMLIRSGVEAREEDDTYITHFPAYIYSTPDPTAPTVEDVVDIAVEWLGRSTFKYGKTVEDIRFNLTNRIRQLRAERAT